MRLIDADALRADYFVTSTTTNTPLYRYVSMKQIANAPTVEPASPWHRVEDELPKDGEWAIFTNGKVVSVERFKVDAYNHFFPASKWFDFEDAIAWMPLPEPPKEDAWNECGRTGKYGERREG